MTTKGSSTRFERTCATLTVAGPALAYIIAAVLWLIADLLAMFSDYGIGWFLVAFVVSVAFAQIFVIVGLTVVYWLPRVQAASSGGEPPTVASPMRLYLLLFPSLAPGLGIAAASVDGGAPPIWFWFLIGASLFFVVPAVIDSGVRARRASKGAAV